MSAENKSYEVVVYTKRLPGSFRGPSFLKRFLSLLSESPNAQIGPFRGKDAISEAIKEAQNQTIQIYTDGYGRLRSSRGAVVKEDF